MVVGKEKSWPYKGLPVFREVLVVVSVDGGPGRRNSVGGLAKGVVGVSGRGGIWGRWWVSSWEGDNLWVAIMAVTCDSGVVI